MTVDNQSLIMFGVLPPGVKTGESYSDFTDSTLLTPAPITCWPATLGTLAADIINNTDGRTPDLKGETMNLKPVGRPFLHQQYTVVGRIVSIV